MTALNGNISSRPIYYLRIDVAHLIKLVYRWTCWKGKRTITLKEYYVRCTKLLIKSESLFEFQNILIDILTVCYSETEGECQISNTNHPSKVAREKLLNQLKHISLFEIAGAIEECNESVDEDNKDNANQIGNDGNNELFSEEENNYSKSTFSKITIFLDEIKRESKSRAHLKGDKISAYLIPELGKQILRICKEFPL